MMRVMLYEAAQSMLRSKKWWWLEALGHEDRQKTRHETRDRRRGTADGGRDAPYMG